MSNSASGLQYDELGFLIGLKQTGKDVSKIDKNVEQIRDILIGLHKEIENQYSRAENQPRPKLSALEQALIDAQIKPADFTDLIREQANPLVQSSIALDRVAKSIEDLISESLSNESDRTRTTNPKPRRSRRTIEINSTEDVIREFGNTGERERDANGRFVGSKSEQSTLGKVAQTIGTAIKGVIPSNPQGVDPTLDAINEVANVLSPVKRAAGFMLRPLTGWMKSRKRNEPIPKEQSDHNRRQIKLLQRLVDNLQSRGGLLGGLGKLLGAGGGLLGSLFGGLLGKGKGLGKGLSKILKFGKGLPVIGALLTAMSFSDWGSKTTKEKGGTVGSAVGGIAGGALGSLLGPVGTIAGAAIGSWVGDKLGGVVAPYVKKWTDSLIDADIPTMISKLVSIALKLTPIGMAKSLYDWAKEKTGGGFNPGTLLRSQYGGKGVNEANPVQFGDAYNSGKLNNNVNARKEAFKFFTGKGWSKEQAAGIIANLDHESNFNTKAIGDGGKAVGIAQWHPDRQANFKKVYGKNLKDASLKEQFEFINYEMTKGAEQNAGNKLKQAKTAGEAGAIVSKYYERPLLTQAEASKRAATANTVLNEAKTYDLSKADNSQTSISNTGEVKSTAQDAIKNTATTITQKAKNNVPVLNMNSSVKPEATRTNNLAANYSQPKIDTNIQPAKEFLTSKAPQEVVVTNQNSGTINQNVSNRLLAHAITGGLGMGDKWNG